MSMFDPTDVPPTVTELAELAEERDYMRPLEDRIGVTSEGTRFVGGSSSLVFDADAWSQGYGD